MIADDNTIFPAEDALVLSKVLQHASDRIPGISEDERTILLAAAHILISHGCNAVIANAVAEQSLARMTKGRF